LTRPAPAPYSRSTLASPIQPPPLFDSTPLTLGLVGGIASGKSSISRAFQRLGARALDADPLAKEFLDLPEVRRSLAAAFGDVETDGRVDHGKLAKVAFDSPESAARLNALLHPHVSAEIDRRIAAWRAGGFRGPVVIDAALLLEAGMGGRADVLVFVDTPLAIRRERAKARGWPDGELERRERLQMPLDKKRAACAYVVDNGASEAEAEAQVKALADRIAARG
jgi:dephospho-CoA kinase